MNFQEAERAYEDLRAQYSSGKLSNSDFENEVSKLKVQDADGRWWQIGVQSGDWYVHDGTKWSKATPPVRPSTPPPATPPPASEPPPVVPATSATGGVPPAPSAAASAKPSGPSRLTPRFFSAAPATRGGGLPTPVLIGIIAVVGLVVIAILIAAGMLITGQFSGGSQTPVAVKSTNTPAGGLALLPSPTLPVLPTIPPPPPATATSPLLPTVAITATTAVTPTKTAAPVATGPAGPTATKKPAGPPSATATKAPALAPGVYAMKMRTDPAQPAPNQPMTFYVTFYNNTGNVGPSTWIVKIYRCATACTGAELADNKSIGETPKANTTVLPGTTELSAGPWTVGLGGCNLVASPYYVDPLGNVVPFPTQTGDRMYYNFKLCQ